MIKISKSKLDDLEQKSGKISKEWDDIANRIVKIKGSLDMEILAMENIKETLNKAEKSSRKEKEFYTGFQNGVKKTKTDFENEEKNLASKIAGAIAIGAGVGAVSGKVSGIVTGNSNNAPGKKTVITSPKTSTTVDSNTSITKMDDKAIKDEIQNRFNTIQKWDSVDGKFNGQCSRLVNYQLQEKGIFELTRDGDSGVRPNGKNFASALVNNQKVLQNGYKATAYKSYDDLFSESKKGVMTNVVCSYTSASKVSSRDEGHVVLIDRIQDGKVYFIDNFGFNHGTGKQQNKGEVMILSIEDFKRDYNKPVGIAHLHQ